MRAPAFRIASYSAGVAGVLLLGMGLFGGAAMIRKRATKSA